MNGKSTTTSSISQELTGTLQMARYPLFQRLQRCTNVILVSARNSDLIDNECLEANISITAPPAWAITRAVTIVFRVNILHENPVQVPLSHLAKIVEMVARHCDSKPKQIERSPWQSTVGEEIIFIHTQYNFHTKKAAARVSTNFCVTRERQLPGASTVSVHTVASEITTRSVSC
jgi:hypothetical protein